MKNAKSLFSFIIFLIVSFPHIGFAQEKHYFQTDFQIEDFEQRRSKVFDGIGNDAIALLQGSSGNANFGVFRQSNSFYYLCGI